MIISHKFTHRLSIYTLVLTLSLITTHQNTHSRIGCISNGSHLGDKQVRRRYDTKEYHYVQCNCPCVMLLGKKQTCSQCGHRHDQRRLIIIDSDKINNKIAANQNKIGTAPAHNPEQAHDPRYAIEVLLKHRNSRSSRNTRAITSHKK